MRASRRTRSALEISKIMTAIRSKDTRPELIFWAIARRLGIQLSRSSELPFRPDFLLPGCRLAIFVHGCFWHQHPGCRFSKKPVSNLSYWTPKLARIQARDRRQRRQLSARGWASLIVWECEFADPQKVYDRL